jgi:hypothetical protein
MAITYQPTETSLYSAYSQIPVETDNLTSGLEIKTQNLISLNIIDNEQFMVIDNSSGSSNNYFVKFPIPRRAVAGEWYTFWVGFGVGATSLTVALFQATASDSATTVIAKKNIPIGPSMTWSVQVPTDITIKDPHVLLVIFAGIEGATAGAKVILNNMTLTYGKNPVQYTPSSMMAANLLTESIDIYRDSGFGTTKKYDLSFLAKAGFRDRPRTYPFVNQHIAFSIDYNLISAYAYRGIGEQDFNVRYASRGVRPRGHDVNFSASNIGLALTDRTPDNNRNLYVKKYYGYPYFVTLFPKGVSRLNSAIPITVRVKRPEGSSGSYLDLVVDISSRFNIPFVCEFEDENADGAEYVKIRPSGEEFSNEAWNIMFVDTEVPCNPFYIRWINRKGGWDTYMFEQHKKYTQEVDRGDQYVLANARNPYTSETRGELAPEFKNIVQAGAEQLDENDFNLLKGIALSPLVQVYNYQIGAWQRVLVDDTDLTWDTKAPRNTVSYEFQLIDEQTQW